MHLFASKFVNKPDQVTEVAGSVTTPPGFVAAGIAAGIKKTKKRDLGLLFSKSSCASATVFTANAAAAPPVKVCRDETENRAIQAIIVNSGCANACTGGQGLEDARSMVQLTAARLGLKPELAAAASTGVIGQRLPMEAIEPGIEFAADELSVLGGADFAEAIRTTDKVDKEGAVKVELSGGEVSIGACAKGAGMIAPNMATLLVFMTTDAAVPAATLQDMLNAAVRGSFNAISVDGDMSTNDSVFLLANGQSGVAIEPGGDDAAIFSQALTAVCRGLALKMVEDGEGATKVIELNIRGASSGREGQRVANEVSNSLLVKTAFYGRDPNWGRLMAAAGSALAGEPELAADIHFEEICLARGGSGEMPDEERLKEIMAEPEILVTMDLHRGGAGHTMYFSDLTHDYVTLNAEYRT